MEIDKRERKRFNVIHVMIRLAQTAFSVDFHDRRRLVQFVGVHYNMYNVRRNFMFRFVFVFWPSVRNAMQTNFHPYNYTRNNITIVANTFANGVIFSCHVF